MACQCRASGTELQQLVDARGNGTHGSVHLTEGVAPGAPGRVALKRAHLG